MGLGQIPATGIPQVDALLARLPEEAANFQRIPGRLTAANNALLRVPGQFQVDAQALRNRIAQAQATYGRLAGIVADLMTAYRQHTITAAQIPQAISLATGVAGLQRTVKQIEAETAALAGGAPTAKVGVQPLVYAAGGAVVGGLMFGTVGALIGGALGLFAGARR
ncbi:MAG: hypothetical protein ACRD0K_10140 [Egibacteraceae bacterium]